MSVCSLLKVLVVVGTNSVASDIITSKIFVGVHVGQLEVFSNYSGPCVHNSDDFNCCTDISLVRSSAGLSAEGVNDHCVAGKCWSISMIHCWTNDCECVPFLSSVTLFGYQSKGEQQ